jgi:hypothetical protein
MSSAWKLGPLALNCSLEMRCQQWRRCKPLAEANGRLAGWDLLKINSGITGMKGQVGLIRLPPIKPFGLVKAVEDRRL